MAHIYYTNKELAEIFEEIANLLEIKGEVIYKILAYRKAADSLNNLGRDINDVWQEGKLTDIPGIGKALAEKISELLSTGKLGFLEKLHEEVPSSLVKILEVPDVGPKKVSLFWKELGITNLEELEAAARTEKLRQLPRLGAKSEARILAGIEALARRSDRTPLGKAWPFAQELLQILRAIPGVRAAEAAGSLRRMRETVGDLDLLVAAADSTPVMEAFTKHPEVVRVVSQGKTKASVEYRRDLRAQLWVHAPERFGTALQYASGSKEHNVRLRELAVKQGLSLSEQAFTNQNGSETLCAAEEEVYATLGLPWIPPELREDHGEIQAAKANQLPDLVSINDIRAELHCHSTWSDGKLSIRELANIALNRGFRVLAITDHSGGLRIAGGMSIEDLKKQRVEINQIQEEIGDKLRILQGCEVEIRADGSLDYPDDVLAQLDLVIASLHISLRQPRHQVTERLLNAICNPHVNIIAHPTGRIIPNREGADLDMDAVLAAASEHNTALEINANPSRLDLNDVYTRRAIENGVPLSINTDAHNASEFDLLHFGIATARRGWATAAHVINTWETAKLLDWLLV